MKNIPISLILFFGIQVSLFSQDCLPWGVQFFTQQEIDDFQVNYPGCTEIGGLVTVFGPTITDLDGLSIVTAMKGGISIFDCPNLLSIDGLSNVIYLGPGGNVFLSGLPNLESLAGLEGLDTINGSLIIGGGSYGGIIQLENLAGLNNLKAVGGYVEVSNCSALTSLWGLHQLSSIGGRFNIFNNNLLPNLSGLESLTSVGLNPVGPYGDDLNIGDPGMGGNDSLQSLIGLNNLQTIGGDLNIVLNWNLQTLFGLQNLISIGGNLHLFYNDQITNLQGLESIESIGGKIDIASCLSLETLQGIENIAGNSIEGIDISMNPLLSECDIQSICSFLISPTGIVTFENNAPGCNSPAEVEEACMSCLPEGIWLSTQQQIDSFPINYQGCTQIEGSVYIGNWDPTNITNLDSLIQLTTIAGGLSIEANSLLTSLSGLNNLVSIAGTLEIGNWEQPNINLVSLDGLNNNICGWGCLY